MPKAVPEDEEELDEDMEVRFINTRCIAEAAVLSGTIIIYDAPMNYTQESDEEELDDALERVAKSAPYSYPCWRRYHGVNIIYI